MHADEVGRRNRGPRGALGKLDDVGLQELDIVDAGGAGAVCQQLRLASGAPAVCPAARVLGILQYIIVQCTIAPREG